MNPQEIIKNLLAELDWKQLIDMILDMVEENNKDNFKAMTVCKIIRMLTGIPDVD